MIRLVTCVFSHLFLNSLLKLKVRLKQTILQRHSLLLLGCMKICTKIDKLNYEVHVFVTSAFRSQNNNWTSVLVLSYAARACAILVKLASVSHAAVSNHNFSVFVVICDGQPLIIINYEFT